MISALFIWGLKLAAATTALLGLVLLLRRPLARFWGAEAAYLLWALPFLRLFMPDIRLPVGQDINIMPWPAAQIDGLMADISAPAEQTAPPPLAAETGAQFDITLIGPFLAVLWVSIGAAWFIWQLWRHKAYWTALNQIGDPALPPALTGWSTRPPPQWGCVACRR